MEIIIKSAETVTLDSIEIEFVRDDFDQKRIIAKIKDIPRPVILWNGEADYAAAGDWTNDTAAAQASAVLALSSIPWAF